MRAAVVVGAIIASLIGVLFVARILSFWHPRIIGYGILFVAVVLLIYGLMAKSPEKEKRTA